MRLYFPVDLTGNLIMIEKLVLGEILTGDLPILNPDALTSAPLQPSVLPTSELLKYFRFHYFDNNRYDNILIKSEWVFPFVVAFIGL